MKLELKKISYWLFGALLIVLGWTGNNVYNSLIKTDEVLAAVDKIHDIKIEAINENLRLVSSNLATLSANTINQDARITRLENE